MLAKEEISSLFTFGGELAAKSRALILSHLKGGFTSKEKSDGSLVTTVDLAAEELLRSLIEERYPSHGIIGEELENRAPDSEYQWILDPIDGTLNLARGIPTYGTIIGLHFRGDPIVGFLDHPSLGVLYSAGKGLGAFRNGEKIHIEDFPSSPHVLGLGSRDIFAKSKDEGIFDLLSKHFPKLRVYYDCFAHALAAQGSLSAVVEFNSKIWDIAATELLIEEAGGKFVEVKSWVDSDGIKRYSNVFGRSEIVEKIKSLIANG